MSSAPRFRALPALLAAFLVGFVAVPPAIAEEVPFALFQLATARPGGVYKPLGESLCHIYNLDRPDTLPACRARTSGGSVENIERLRSGEARIAIVQADVLHWAWIGTGPFAAAGPFPELAVLFAAHDEIATVLVAGESGITEPAGLRGRRIAVGVQESGSRATLDSLLGALGWAPSDFASLELLAVNAQIDALCAGTIDAAAFVVGHPSGYVQRALYDCGARLLPMDSPRLRAAVDALPFLRIDEIPAGTYRGQDQPIAAPALTALVVARRDLPAETARAFVTAIRARQDILRKMHPALAGLELDRASRAVEEVGMHEAVREE